MRALLVGLVALLMACTGPSSGEQVVATSPSPTAMSAEALAAEAATQPDDRVDLTVYFRRGTGADAHLVPVKREVPVSGDLPREALELLLAGPTQADGQGLAAPLPTTTRLLRFTVARGIAVVDLSAEAIADAASVGATAENETLALGAVANTLTEFPFVDEVRVQIEGQQAGHAGDFWGGWGLPALLVRDDSLIGPSPEGEGIAELSRFSLASQTAGSADAGPVEVVGVRARQRTTYLRVAVQLAEPEDGAAAAAVPPVRALVVGGTIVLEIDQVAAYSADFAPGQRIDVRDPGFGSVTVETVDLPGTVRIVVTPLGPAPPASSASARSGDMAPSPSPEARPFWLHVLSSPTRVVLDVRK